MSICKLLIFCRLSIWCLSKFKGVIFGNFYLKYITIRLFAKKLRQKVEGKTLFNNSHDLFPNYLMWYTMIDYLLLLDILITFYSPFTINHVGYLSQKLSPIL